MWEEHVLFCEHFQNVLSLYKIVKEEVPKEILFNYIRIILINVQVSYVPYTLMSLTHELVLAVL